MSAATGPGIAADAARRRGILIPVLCVVATLGSVHAGLGIGLLIGDGVRGSEFFPLLVFAALLLFVMPGLLIATLAGDALVRRVRTGGGVLGRKRYLGVTGVVIALALVLGLLPLYRWHTLLFMGPACLVVIGGAVALLLAAQRA